MKSKAEINDFKGVRISKNQL